MPRRLLIADDSRETLEDLRSLLEEEGYEIDVAADGDQALAALRAKSFSILLTDLKMPGKDGMTLIREIRELGLPTAVVVVTGFGDLQQAVQAVQLGAADFLAKPIDPDHLRLVLGRILRERGLQDELAQLRERLQSSFSFRNVLSKSPRMHELFELIGNIAATNSTVLLEGETGTGKEQVARAIHEASETYRGGPFVPVHCAALPKDLVESELFGHEKGSFTGAAGRRIGRFETAHGGTLFLDEVGDIPPAIQVKLLRVLQEREFERLGGSDKIQVDVRVVAATNRSLLEMVRKGDFREDLYYRLNVVRIELPPLRDRAEDIPLLAAHFAARYSRPGQKPPTFTGPAMERLLRHSWPGNVRELENAVERACVTVRGNEIDVKDLPPEVSGDIVRKMNASPIDISRPLPDLLKDTIADLEKRYLRRALKRSRGNIEKCARISGLSRRSISAKLAEYGIDKNEFKRKPNS